MSKGNKQKANFRINFFLSEQKSYATTVPSIAKPSGAALERLVILSRGDQVLDVS